MASEKPKKDLILSIDPGTNSGWSIHDPNLPLGREQLIDHGKLSKKTKTVKGKTVTVSIPTGLDFAKVVQNARSIASGRGVDLEVVIEDQYLGTTTSGKDGFQRSNQNFKTTKVVVRSSGGWKFVAEAMGVQPDKIRFVNPQTWQSDVMGIQGVRLKRDALKRMSQSLVESMFGVKVTQDESDSILIGRFRAVQVQFGV